MNINENTSEGVIEEDFWKEEIESSPCKPQSPVRTEKDYFRSLTVNRSPQKKFLFKSVTLKGSETIEELQKSAVFLRERNIIQVDELSKEVRANTRKELKDALAEINAEFEKEIHEIRLEHDKMKDTISKRNRELTLFGKFLDDQEFLITQNRLAKILKKEIPAPSQASIAEKKSLATDLRVLKVQIESLKEAVVDYTNETYASEAKLKELNIKIAGIKAVHRQEFKVLEEQLLLKLQNSKKDRDTIKLAFETYKKSGWNELEDQEKKLEKQRIIIVSLQNELKTAKGILYHPKLKLRVHSTLQGYVEEYEQDDEIEKSLLSQSALKYAGAATGRSKTIGRKKFTRSNDLSWSTNFQSMVSDNGSAFSKVYGRKTAYADNFKTKLSPLKA
ncbi:hypothetical protein SteCoe_37661 [Stentor coeruleus]|uniref:Uncharacterized protein n=1 Tax=Stentor coeruleus TaxID=5963 RepID=A0A1R2AML1_9CILI|nr:hypothetical protein SteCoe_37661 [Stentor coeruleus]